MQRLLLTILGTLALCATADAQAYCALRDPNKQIYRLFPEADAYRSIVRTVNKEARRDVAQRLPFTLHFNELGRHTLYVASKDGEALGFVHVRSEAGRWGLVEITWALDLDMRVVDFEFQRCRDRSKTAFADERVRAAIIGKDFHELRALIDRRGKRLVEGALPVGDAALDLGAVLVRNALKTIAATECVWRKDLWTLRAERFAHDIAPACRSIRPLGELYGDGVLDELDAKVGSEGTGIVRESALAWDLLCEQGTTLTRVFVARWQQDDLVADVLWFVAPDGELKSIEPQGNWPQKEVMETFRAQVGKDVDALCDCGGSVELAAYEVLLTLAMQGTKEAATR